MKALNRILSLLLCLILAISTPFCALAEGDMPLEILMVEEIAPALESSPIFDIEPDPAPSEEPAAEPDSLQIMEVDAEDVQAPEAENTEVPVQNPEDGSIDSNPGEPQPELAAQPEILVEKKEMILGVGESASLSIAFSDGGSYALSFSSSESSIAEVSADGVITAMAAGTACICIRSEAAGEALVNILVVPAPEDISLAAPKTAIGEGEAMQLLPVITAEASSGALKYTSSKPSVASVDANGIVTGKKAGTATISVSTYNDLKATLKITVKKAPTSVKITADRSELGVGETMQLGYKLSKDSAGSVAFSSENPEIAAVSLTGEVTALSPGTVKIIVASHNGKTAKANITIKEAPAFIQLSDSFLSIGEGDSWKLGYALNEGALGTVQFASSDESIAAVDTEGKILAKLQGTAEITATAHNGVSAACSVSVVSAPEGVVLASAKKTIGIGEAMQLDSTILPEALSGTLKYSSSSSKIVKVNQKGVVTGLRTGTAKITVSTFNGHKSTVSIKVVKAPSSLKITADRTALGVGENLQLGYKLNKDTAASVNYTSSNPEILHVTQSGYLTALAAGTATITAVTHNELKKNMSFTVNEAPTGVAFEKGEYMLGAGETLSVSAVLPEGSAGEILYESSDSSIAAIDAKTGAVQGVAPGTATLYARTYNGVETSCAVTVKNAPEGVAFQESSITISVGDRWQLQAPLFSGEDAHSAALKYSSADKKIAAVSADGLVTGKRAGTIKITVTTFNKKKDTVKVIVKAAPKSISFAEKDVTLFVDTAYTPKVNLSNKALGNYTLSSSNPDVAWVNGNTIHTVADGTAVITATSFNGKTAGMNLTVPALPESIALDPAAATLGAGDSCTLYPVIPEGQGSRLTYESSDTGIAVVNQEGVVTAVHPGSAAIRAITQNGLVAESIIDVVPAPTTVHLTPHSAFRSLNEDALQLQAGFGSAEEGGRLIYTSSNPAVATVSDDGLVKFHAVGSAKITATTYNGHSASCSLTIGEMPGAISFAQDEYKIALGDCVQIPLIFDSGCESYSLSTGDASIASAIGDTVRGLAIGSTTLTATSRSGHFASCILTVVEPPTGIVLSHSSAELTLRIGDTLQLSADVLPEGAGSVHYISSDPNIAAVDYHTGLVTPVGHGECTITARTYDGKHTAQCSIKTVHLLAGVKIGIDPGHQLVADRSTETIAPGSSSRRHKVASGTRGVSTKVREHVVNLQIGLKLRDALESFGAEVHMTRETADVNISNQQRAKMMNNLGVDLVLRIHCNASNRSSVHGMSIYVRQTGTKKAESKAAAKLILKYMSAETGAKNLGVKYSNGYTGLNWSTVPSMLMELGYMTNHAEDKKLNNPEYQDKLVIGMINGICEYMGREIPYKEGERAS